MWSSAGQLLADELSALLPETNIAVLHHEVFGLYGEPTYGFDRITAGDSPLGGNFQPGIHEEFSLNLDVMLPYILPAYPAKRVCSVAAIRLQGEALQPLW